MRAVHFNSYSFRLTLLLLSVATATAYARHRARSDSGGGGGGGGAPRPPSGVYKSVQSTLWHNRGLRLLVAGDKSQSGKSTVSLGLLQALLDLGYAPEELAYIKPATQCVSSTLTARFCEARGIACEHIGPVVYYRGFTREQIDAPPDAAAARGASLVAECAAAVERISRGKRLTLIDGVGYPSVGSVVGCSSADVAVACRAPVLIVGKQGVGDAVDSFNLCARFFEAQRVPVLGVVFNKLPPKGFYGLEQCERYVRRYFEASRPRQRVYGVLPQSAGLAALAPEEACGLNYERPDPPPPAGEMTADDEAALATVATLFRAHFDAAGLVADLADADARPAEWAQALAEYDV